MAWPAVTYTFSPSTITKSSEVNQNFTDCINNIDKGMPSGAGVEWFTNTAPSGFLLQDGSAVSRTTYARLFAVIGTTYGVGDGSTTFNLPNKKGKVGVGRDAGQTEFDALAETGGEKTHVLTTAEMPVHTHIQNAHNHQIPGTSANTGSNGDTPVGGPTTPSNTMSTANSTPTNQNAGGDAPHNNLQPYLVQNFIIKD